MKYLFAFTGRAGSGKDTAAQFLIALINDANPKVQVLPFAFANILKDITGRSLNISDVDGDILKRLDSARVANGLTIRQYYNTLGDAIKSYFGIDIWARLTLDHINGIDTMVGLDTVIITDLRYPVEQDSLISYCQQHDTKLIVVKMKNLNSTQRNDNLNIEEHESEYLVDAIKEDYEIAANNIEEIEEKIKEIYDVTTNSTPTD